MVFEFATFRPRPRHHPRASTGCSSFGRRAAEESAVRRPHRWDRRATLENGGSAERRRNA